MVWQIIIWRFNNYCLIFLAKTSFSSSMNMLINWVFNLWCQIQLSLTSGLKIVFSHIHTHIYLVYNLMKQKKYLGVLLKFVLEGISCLSSTSKKLFIMLFLWQMHSQNIGKDRMEEKMHYVVIVNTDDWSHCQSKRQE